MSALFGEFRGMCRIRALLAVGFFALGCGDSAPDFDPSEPPLGFSIVRGEAGATEIANLDKGRPADLSSLEPEERRVVEEADARAPDIRTRILELWVDEPGAELTITQVAHGFTFGFPIELNRFREPGDLEWFTRTMSDHFDLAVLESDAKWGRVERERGEHSWEFVDANVEWAEANGFRTKGHTLLWGIAPPFSSSALPPWALERYAELPLPPALQADLREDLRSFVRESVTRYRGRISIWDASNETLQPLAQWFVERLGSAIVADVFRWAREADPDVKLVFNEWIVEVFTGFTAPTAADVRDRVLELLADGVPIDAVGQQAHFAPAVAFVDPTAELRPRTRLDDYARALDTLAETGLPIHLTETNFIAPPEPELRAAQAEALLRLWWGHPSVEQIVFWGPWNKVAGRDEFEVGFWDDERNLTRHGEAVLSLLNDRWRTHEVVVAGDDGRSEVRACLGEYVAEWVVEGRRVHARFTVERGEGPAQVALLTPSVRPET
ncbi:MAG: endo-1,4-beta-xylanase [bacterium]